MPSNIISQLCVEIASGRYEPNMIQRIILNGKRKYQNYFTYCPKGEIFLIMMLKAEEYQPTDPNKLQIILYLNTLQYIWIDRLTDYIKSIHSGASDYLPPNEIKSYELPFLHLGHTPSLKIVLDQLINTPHELRNACSLTYGENCFTTRIDYVPQFDLIFQ